ncbi:MAG: hypothetical protein KQH63_04850 [Desulfobulbaceae bacterium]|nr:hypothetical protein [Desulfobulbaceae bacterium]
MINRAAVILKYKGPMVKWICDSDPYNKDFSISMEDANEERTVYLVDDREADHIEEWIKLNFRALFESELENWYTDESLWPAGRNLELFNEWFEVKCHSMIVDTVEGPIVDDED